MKLISFALLLIFTNSTIALADDSDDTPASFFREFGPDASQDKQESQPVGDDDQGSKISSDNENETNKDNSADKKPKFNYQPGYMSGVGF